MRTLLIDNYDSYTYNLYQLIGKINGVAPKVIRNDQYSWSEVLCMLPNYDNVIISPGPGAPENEADFGVCANIFRATKMPTLGVCLGHQGLAHVFGGKVTHAQETMHGRISLIYHDLSGHDDLFENIPSPFKAVRYHSLAVTDLPSCLKTFATTEDGTIMALKHKEFPFWGVQFHPESICTEYGEEILKNFAKLTKTFYQQLEKKYPRISHSPFSTPPSSPEESLEDEENCWMLNSPPDQKENDWMQSYKSDYQVLVKKLPFICDSASAYMKLYKDKPTTFWLDSARVEAGLSRFSFMGAAGGPLSFVVKYNEPERRLEITTFLYGRTQIQRRTLNKKELFMDWLQFQLDKYQTSNMDLPFDFNCGFVGYFGYEMKNECGAPPSPFSDATYENEREEDKSSVDNSHPDAAFIFADQLIAFDHQDKQMYVLALCDQFSKDSMTQAYYWMDEMGAILNEIYQQNEAMLSQNKKLPDLSEFVASVISDCANSADDSLLKLARNREEYLKNISNILEKLKDGESYEVCLTTQIFSQVKVDPNDFYLSLRKRNPAPYASFLKFMSYDRDNVGHVIASSSPERFLKIYKNGVAESKPIKGTLPRGKTEQEDLFLKNKLQTSVKDLAENLMIVDLLRNDLGQISEIGTISVPKLMQIESYTTVHQLVSTISGKVNKGVTPIHVIKSCFPPGSMTGAPKYRTLQIIDQEERRKRGVYSGVLGFLGLGRAIDLAVVIRTAVISENGLQIGAGGAIVIMSDPKEEFDEMILKARTVIPSIVDCITQQFYKQQQVEKNATETLEFAQKGQSVQSLKTILKKSLQQQFRQQKISEKPFEKWAEEEIYPPMKRKYDSFSQLSCN